MPSALMIRCRAEVPLLTATACLTPTYSAIRSSNSGSLGPKLRWGVRNTETTASISLSVISGRANDISTRYSLLSIYWFKNSTLLPFSARMILEPLCDLLHPEALVLNPEHQLDDLFMLRPERVSVLLDEGVHRFPGGPLVSINERVI